MSSPDVPRPGRVGRRELLAGLGLLLVAAPALAGCGGGGFQPLYGETASGERMKHVLAKVDIAPIPSRVGQRVRNDLLFYMHSSHGHADTPDYRLDIALRESVQSILVTISGAAQGQVYQVDSTFKLVRLKDNKVVLTANAYARAPFEVNKVADPNSPAGTSDGRSIFANIRARTDAENRAASTLANDIKTRVAAFLSGAA
jgi:LPS-assembly lipoprotein